MSNFTPGPWKVFSLYANKEIRDSSGLLVAVALTNEDAQLIAAAPDLVKVLQQAHRFLRKQDYNMYEIDLVLAKAGIYET